MRNRKSKRYTTSAYKGVKQRAAEKILGVWSAEIFDKNLGLVNLGTKFPTEKMAAAAYDAASLILFGEDGFRNLDISEIPQEIHKLAAVKIEGKKNRNAKRERQKHFIETALDQGKTVSEIRRALNISQFMYDRLLQKISKT